MGINKPFSVASDFHINIDFSSQESKDEVDGFYKQFKCSAKESLQTIFKSEGPEKLIESIPSLKPYAFGMQVSLSHNPVYIYGNYLKLSRLISQTPWSVDGGDEIQDSVQDAISRTLTEEFQGTTGILHSSVRFN